MPLTDVSNPPLTNDQRAQCGLEDIVAMYATRVISLRVGVDAALEADMVDALILRDAISRRLADDIRSTPEPLLALMHADEELRRVAPRLEQLLGVKRLRNIKATAAPKDSGWWWDVEQYLPRPTMFWNVVAAVMIAGAVGLLTEVAHRFFAEGPDLVGAVYIVLQTGLTVVAGGTLLTSTTGGVFERWLDDHGVKRGRQGWAKAAVALVLLSVTFGVYQSLPWISQQYNAAGVSRARQGGWSQAIQDFKRALSLAPDFSEAHYNLGRAHEAVAEYDSARTEYQKAIELDRKLYLAYNSLARLYIVDKKDPASALRLIDEGLVLVASSKPDALTPEARIALLKNRGWANLQAKNLAQARLDLQEALALAPQRASVHCVLAQVDEARGATDSSEWDQCLGYSPGASDVESDWLAKAQDHAAQIEVVK